MVARRRLARIEDPSGAVRLNAGAESRAVIVEKFALNATPA
jgi:hypothetical protein